MKRNIKTMLSLSAFALTLSMSSCVGDLDVKPIDPNLNTKVDVEALFNKCFANLGISGNGSSDDDCDVDGIDGGTSGFVRQLFNSNYCCPVNFQTAQESSPKPFRIGLRGFFFKKQAP